jgi:hypothetical protein
MGRIVMGRIVMGRIVMGRVVRGASCHGASCPWGELSMGQVVHGASGPWGELSLGRVVYGASCRGASFDGASCPWGELSWGEWSHYYFYSSVYSRYTCTLFIVCSVSNPSTGTVDNSLEVSHRKENILIIKPAVPDHLFRRAIFFKSWNTKTRLRKKPINIQ